MQTAVKYISYYPITSAWVFAGALIALSTGALSASFWFGLLAFGAWIAIATLCHALNNT